MRHLIILIVVSVISLPLNAQSSSKVKEKTLKLFEGYAYYDVINNYKKLRNLDIEEKRILGLSYWKTNQLTSAEDVFSQIVELEDHSSDDLFHYACILRENQDYETSLIWMNKFTEMAPEDSRAIDFLEHENEIQPDEEDDIHKVNRLLMNTEDQDFGTSYFGDKLVFSSTRRLSRMILRKWNGNNRAFLKVCVADITMDGELEEVEELKEFTNEKFHNGPIAFNSEGDMMVITQNASGTDLKKGPMNLQLFVSYLENEKWSKPEPFSFNSKEYSCGQATISADGKWLYFISTMPGGYGGTDIYRVSINKDKSFSDPENIGPEVNTPGNEMFPLYYSRDGILFYSSDGKIGFGGLDLFVAEVKADYSIGEIINPGKPLNSHKDDFGMIVDSLQKRGYLSSDRIGEGNDDDDIYSLELAEPFAFGKIVEGLVLNEDGMPLIGVLISFVDSTTGISQTFITDESGIYRFDLDGPGVFKINASKEGYSEIEITEETGERGITYVDDLTINKNPEVQFKFSVFDSNDDSPIPGVVVNLKDLETDDDMDNVTKESGDCLMTLPSNPTLNSTRSFDLKIQKEGYLTKIISFDILFDHAGVYDLNEYLKKELRDVEMEKVNVGLDLNLVMDIKAIYFDFAKFDIRMDAEIELDKIVKVMNENENIKIELPSHTDSRGSDSDNLRLSKKRAKASENYIKERITNPERVTSEGFGETELLNECDDGVNCSEEKHQSNRRTEFIILEL